MYWSLWRTGEDGKIFLENVPDEWVDARLKDSPNEIIFEAELTTDKQIDSQIDSLIQNVPGLEGETEFTRK